MIFFVEVSWELTRHVRTQIFSKCRKSAIPLYAEARQFHLLQVQCNLWIRLSFLNKHLTFSDGFRRIFRENLRKFQTAGYLDFSKPYPDVGYVDTYYLLKYAFISLPWSLTSFRYSAHLKSSVAYTHGQYIDTKLTNQSARFTQVVLKEFFAKY